MTAPADDVPDTADQLVEAPATASSLREPVLDVFRQQHAFTKGDVVRNASSQDAPRLPVEQGMRTLRQDGWLKVAGGLTTMGDVPRVVA